MRPALAALAFLTAASGASAATVQDGVFSAGQAERGRAVYADRCVLCHGERMEGTMNAPPLADIGFVFVWDGRPLSELFDFTKTMMPPAEIGSLKDQEIADITAAILDANGFPQGPEATELPGDAAALAAITIVRGE